MGSTASMPTSGTQLHNEVGFQAHLHDSDVGSILMRARAFDPTTGQFLQPDPVGHEDSVNLYAGMGWDPVNMRDRQAGSHRSASPEAIAMNGIGSTRSPSTSSFGLVAGYRHMTESHTCPTAQRAWWGALRVKLPAG